MSRIPDGECHPLVELLRLAAPRGVVPCLALEALVERVARVK